MLSPSRLTTAHAIFVKTLACHFVEIEMLILKWIWKCKEPGRAKEI